MVFDVVLAFLPEEEAGSRSPVSKGVRFLVLAEAERKGVLAAFDFLETEYVFPGDKVKAVMTVLDDSRFYAGLDFEFYDAGTLNGHGTITQLR